MNSLIIFGAKYLVYLIIAVAGIYFLIQPRDRQKQLALFGLFSLPLTYLIAKIADWLYYNPRPFISEHITPLFTHSADNGFPSDHTLISAALAVVIFTHNKKLGTILMILAILVGVSRVAAGVHHLIDIVASLLIAIIVGAVVYNLTPKLKTKN